jgi:hypothetical protein
MEENANANMDKPVVDRDAYAANLKAAKLRLDLARQRADSASKTLRDVRVGNSIVQRGVAELSGQKAALQGELALAQARLNALEKTPESINNVTQNEIDRYLPQPTHHQHARTHMHMHTHTHTRTCTHTHTHTHTHARARAHTHTRARTHSLT